MVRIVLTIRTIFSYFRYSLKGLDDSGFFAIKWTKATPFWSGFLIKNKYS